MKKLLAPLAILIAAFSMATAHAQTAGTSGTTGTTATQTQTQTAQTGAKTRVNRQKMMADVLAKLNLTADQQAKIKALREKEQAAQKDFRKQVKAGTIQKADVAKKRQAMNKEAAASLEAILTKDQAKQFKTLIKEEREKAKQNAKSGTIKPY